MALIAPLFSLLLVVFACWAHLALIRLALIQLTRDTSILLASDAHHWLESASLQQDEMRELAKQYPLLETRYLDLDVEPLTVAGSMNLGSGYLGKLIAGATVHLRYHLQPRGLLGKIYPGGLDLEEWAAVQGDPWCNPMETVVKAFL